MIREVAPPPERIRGATVCSGIGAPETALPEVDWVWSAEIEDFPSKVLRERHPKSINLGDITASDFIEQKAIGNSMAVSVIRWIGLRILDRLRKE